MNEQAEFYVGKYGECYRDLIEDSLSWLRSKEEAWGVPFNRKDDDQYIADLVSRAKPKEQS